MRVIPVRDLGERAVVRRDNQRRVGPLFFSSGDIDLLCGSCSFLLFKGLRSATLIGDTVAICPNCGSGNESSDLR
ncbi:hypothetical protein GCM10027601_20650 [Nocardioides ungokensis]